MVIYSQFTNYLIGDMAISIFHCCQGLRRLQDPPTAVGGRGEGDKSPRGSNAWPTDKYESDVRFDAPAARGFEDRRGREGGGSWPKGTRFRRFSGMLFYK